MISDEQLIKQAHEHFKDARNHSKEWRVEIKENYDFVAGRQLSEEELAYLEEEQRPDIQLNRIGPVVGAIVGQQINNRQEVRYLPREQGDVQVNEVLTGAAQWADDECDAEDEITDCFFDLLVSGMAWSETRMSYDEDPDGKLHTAERVPPSEMYWDPAARKRNLSDRRFQLRARWLPRMEVEARWPEAKAVFYGDDGGVVDMGDVWADENPEPHDAHMAHLYQNDVSEWYKKHTDELLIVHYQWYEREPIYRVGDPQAGRLIELSENKFTKLKDRIEAAGIKYVRQMVKRFYQSFIVGSRVLEKGPSPCPTDFTIRAITGKRDEFKGHWYGLVRGMKDPQRWANKFFCDIQDIVYSNRAGGAYVEEDALVDPRQAEEDWSKPAPMITVKSGALAKGKIQDRNSAAYPVGLDRLMEFAVTSIPHVSGVNMELLGFVDRNQPGVLEMSRKRSGMTILADMFDALRRFNKERGRVVLYFIQTYLSDGRLIRILGEEGKEQYVPLIRDESIGKYDVIVDEAPTSPNQRHETFAMLMELMPMLIKARIMPPAETLDYLPLPASLIQKWKEQLTQGQEDPEKDVALQKEMSEIEETKSKTVLNYAKAETEGAKPEDMAEKRNIDLVKSM